jgi:hypothetical protein
VPKVFTFLSRWCIVGLTGKRKKLHQGREGTHTMNASVFTEIKNYARTHYQQGGWFRVRCLTDRELRQLIGDADSYDTAQTYCQRYINSFQPAVPVPQPAGFVSYIRDFSNAPSRVGRKDWRLLDRLTDEQLAVVIATATTEKEAWSLARWWIRERFDRTTRTEKAPEPGLPVPAPRVVKMTTAEWQSRLSPRDPTTPICWEHAIEGLGAEKNKFRTGIAQHTDVIIAKLNDAGFKAERVPAPLAPAGYTPTLALFAPQHLEGSWLIITRGHALAMKDGVVFDIRRSATVKRVVETAYQITECPALAIRKPVDCDCELDPIVFGHYPACSAKQGGFRQRDW